MQTFLPYPSFTHSLACLDNKRLGKQRVEAKQILMALEFGPYQYNYVDNGTPSWVPCSERDRARLGLSCTRRTPWYNHPATKMWRDYESALALYGFLSCARWAGLGFRDSLMPWFATRCINGSDLVLPPWLSSLSFTTSHQSNLVRKDPAHYRQFFPDVPDNLPYVWPSP